MRYYKIINGEVVFFTGNVLNTGRGSIINPTEEQMLANGWLIYEEPEPTEEQKLQMTKEEKLRQIEAYDSSDNVNQFTIDDAPMWLDHNVRQQLKTSVEAYAAMNQNSVTKYFNGIAFTFTVSEWLQMLAALEVYAAEALNVTEQHKLTVNQMVNIDDIVDYDYTTGYPAKLNF